MLVGQFGVVKAQLVQDRCMQVMDMHWVLGDIVAKFVGLAMYDARFDAAARHPDGETPRVVVTAIEFGIQGTLAIVGPAEFSSKNYEGIIQ